MTVWGRGGGGRLEANTNAFIRAITKKVFFFFFGGGGGGKNVYSIPHERNFGPKCSENSPKYARVGVKDRVGPVTCSVRNFFFLGLISDCLYPLTRWAHHR